MATSYCKSIVCQLCHLQTELIILFDIYKGGHIMFLSFTWAPFVALRGPSYGSPCKKKRATYLANYVSTESQGHCSVQYSTTKNENLGDSQMKMQHWGSWLSIVFIAVKIVILFMCFGKIKFKSNLVEATLIFTFLQLTLIL